MGVPSAKTRVFKKQKRKVIKSLQPYLKGEKRPKKGIGNGRGSEGGGGGEGGGNEGVRGRRKRVGEGRGGVGVRGGEGWVGEDDVLAWGVSNIEGRKP